MYCLSFILVQSTFLDDSVSVEHARDYGHIHLSEVRLLVSLRTLLVSLFLDNALHTFFFSFHYLKTVDS